MIGKKVRGALYVHRQAIGLLTQADGAKLSSALSVAGAELIDWNVVRIEQAVIGLLDYADFREDPFPKLRGSARVDLAEGAITRRSFVGADNPLILHRKELLMDPQDSSIAEWTALTAELERLDLFRDNHLIGRQRPWAERLANAGVRLDGHRLCPR
jgi:DNA phosphorothioation-associated putative methyltransferase